jgi:tRNA-dihydrouridine synthase B
MTHTIYLAPIRGITDKIFRNIFPKYFQGFDLAIAPFICTFKTKKLKGTIDCEFGALQDTGIKTIPQIMGNDPDDFLSVANELNEIGYDQINWNLGCPYPKVTRKGRGSGMLIYPEKIDYFLDRVLSGSTFGVSVKLRLGMNCPDDILRIIPVLNRYPLQEIIIHPRTGQQMYTGSVDLEAFEKCMAISRHTIVFNGDINSLANFEMLANRFKTVNRWMIGRGILKNPFLIEEIKKKTARSPESKSEQLFDFHNELFEEYSKIVTGPVHLISRMKAIWTYLGHYFEDTQTIQRKIQRTENIKDYLNIVNSLFKNA